jgi:hypothetical protein
MIAGPIPTVSPIAALTLIDFIIPLCCKAQLGNRTRDNMGFASP